MNLERIAGVMSQAILGAAWLVVVAMTARVYLGIITRARSTGNAGPAAYEARIRRSFAAFALAFMPALAVWLPAFGLLPSTDQLFIPAILTWLVLLLFGTLQFYLNLIPARAAMIAAVSMEADDSTKIVVAAQSASVEQRSRNV